jgi:hypothetical protein
LAFTNIASVSNETSGKIMFTSTEDAGANREISPQFTSHRNCRVPWCGFEGEFPMRHLAITDVDTDRVLFYIWQRRESDGDFVRASPSGFQDPGPQIPGDSQAGGRDRNLRIDSSGIRLNNAN